VRYPGNPIGLISWLTLHTESRLSRPIFAPLLTLDRALAGYLHTPNSCPVVEIDNKKDSGMTDRDQDY